MRQFYINSIMHAKTGTVLAKALVCAGRAHCISEKEYDRIIHAACGVLK